MKNLPIFIAVSFLVLCFSCKKDNFKNSMNVAELISFTNAADTKCSDTIYHENDIVVVTGYIWKINTFQEGKRFALFETSNNRSQRVDVKMTIDSDNVFKEVTDHFSTLTNPDEDPLKVTIRGKIKSFEMPIMNDCYRGIFLELFDNNYIKFE